MKKRIGQLIGVVLVVGLIVFLLVMRPQNKRFSVTYTDVFDTVTQFTGYAKSEEEFKNQMEVLHQQLMKYHQLFDIYNDYLGVTNMKTVNDTAAEQPVKVEKELFNLLQLSREMYDLTDGKTNVAMGDVLSLWHECRTAGIASEKEARLPKESALKVAGEHMDIRNMVLDEKAQTVFFKDSDLKLDVGSIGKGYAVELLGQYAKKKGIKSLLISVGGNVLTIGKKQDGTLWKLGIQNPENQEEYLCYVESEDTCVVTSGDYQRYYVVDGQIYCHIIDPDTLMPPRRFRSVSIVCKKSGMADALSTALFCMTYEQGKELIDSLSDVEAMWVLGDGSVKRTDGFQAE